MDDDRIWDMERSLWLGDAETYRTLVDDACLMALPHPPYLFTGAAATQAVTETPRWDGVELDERQVSRPQEGLIVIAYHARARRNDGKAYEAFCTSTLRRLAHEEWRVVQHQQTPPLKVAAD